MECPVCDVDISHMSSENQMHHVNQCLDADENFSQSANKLAEHKFDACPICFKEAQCHIDHLKKCAKQKSVFPADLIRIIQRYEKESGNRVKGKKKCGGGVTKKAARPRQSKKVIRTDQDADGEEIIPKKTQDDDSVQSAHFVKTITIRNGRLTTCADLPDRKEVQQKLDHLLKGSVLMNVCSQNSPTELAAMFSLSDLMQSHAFIARGFERLVMDTVRPSKNISSHAPSPIKTGFLPEDNAIQINRANELLERLWQQKDKKSADLLIKTREQAVVACHSMLWCMNTGKPHMTRCGSMFRVDCSAFSKTVVDSFICFCYSGRMRIEAEMEREVRLFLSHFQCEDLLK